MTTTDDDLLAPLSRKELGVIKMDVSKVFLIRLLCNETKTVVKGVSFYDETNICMGTTYFTEDIECKSETDPVKLRQTVVAGAFTGDIDFQSNFFGLQGSSAKYPCVYCLAELSDMNSIWNTVAQ